MFFQGTKVHSSVIFGKLILLHLVATLTAGSQSADLKMHFSGTRVYK